MVVVYDDYLNQSKNYWDPKREEAKAKEDGVYSSKKQTVTDIYNKQSDDTSVAYEDDYRDNAVQKFINEREVAENMANLGLTDSGLNRTQQTAVQLSFANNKAKIDRQKQVQLDTIAQTLATELSAIEQEHLSNVANIDKEYDGYIASMANDNYSAALNAEAELETARINAEAELEKERISASKSEKITNIINSKNGILSREYIGSLDENGVSVTYDISKGTTTYLDRITGYSSTFNDDTNPYTNTVNPNTKYGTFKNGYQPDNIGKNKPLSVEDEKAFRINDQVQNVWKCEKNDKYYVWDALDNDYFEVKKVYKNSKEYQWVEA